MASNFYNVTQFANSQKRNCIPLNKIGTKDVPKWILTTWLLHDFDYKYDSFHTMLNNSQKAKQVKRIKNEPRYNFLLERILNLDT